MTTDDYLTYRRAKFTTRLPKDRAFTQGHVWLAPDGDDMYRVGFTKFATRMLGEVVEFEFAVAAGAQIARGQAIGWIEGFKAVTELYAPLDGRFVGPNPELEARIEDIHGSPYAIGWLYRVEGVLPDDAMDVHEYAAFLDGTIDRMLGKKS